MCFKDTHTPMCLIMLYCHWVFGVKYNQSLGILGFCIIMSWSHLYQGSNELKYTYFFSKSSRLPMTLKLVISFIYRDTAGIWLKKKMLQQVWLCTSVKEQTLFQFYFFPNKGFVAKLTNLKQFRAQMIACIRVNIWTNKSYRLKLKRKPVFVILQLGER